MPICGNFRDLDRRGLWYRAAAWSKEYGKTNSNEQVFLLNVSH
jgi:hypothetical protein